VADILGVPFLGRDMASDVATRSGLPRSVIDHVDE
jgi:hypothetical protein